MFFTDAAAAVIYPPSLRDALPISAYWETLEELSFRTRDDKGKRIPQERLVAEALNLPFVKYNFPVVREGGE